MVPLSTSTHRKPLFTTRPRALWLYEVLQAYREPEKLLVVEGYMDVVALAQFGVDYAVASLGTSTTGDHIQTMFRQTGTVVCCYDGDRAGRDAAWRAMEQALPYLTDGRQLKFMFLPDGEDPDTYIRQFGKEGFEHQIKQAMSLSEFMFNSLVAQVDMSNKEGKAKLKTLAKPLLEKVAGETLREYLLNALGYNLGLPPDQIRLEIKRDDTPKAATASAEHQAYANARRGRSTDPKSPRFVSSLEFDMAAFEEITVPGLNLLISVVDKCRSNPPISLQASY